MIVLYPWRRSGFVCKSLVEWMGTIMFDFDKRQAETLLRLLERFVAAFENSVNQPDAVAQIKVLTEKLKVSQEALNKAGNEAP